MAIYGNYSSNSRYDKYKVYTGSINSAGSVNSADSVDLSEKTDSADVVSTNDDTSTVVSSNDTLIVLSGNNVPVVKSDKNPIINDTIIEEPEEVVSDLDYIGFDLKESIEKATKIAEERGYQPTTYPSVFLDTNSKSIKIWTGKDFKTIRATQTSPSNEKNLITYLAMNDELYAAGAVKLALEEGFDRIVYSDNKVSSFIKDNKIYSFNGKATGTYTYEITFDELAIPDITSNPLAIDGADKALLTPAEAIAMGYTIISTVDDFLNLLPKAYDEKFILMADLDFQGRTIKTMGSIIDEFCGQLNGNGFTIKNLNIDGNGLFYSATHATFSDLRLDNIKVNGRGAEYAGVLCGTSNWSSYENIIIENSSIYDANTAGLLLGYDYSSMFRNINLQGEIDSKNAISPERAGGLVGEGDSCDYYYNENFFVISNVDIKNVPRASEFIGSDIKLLEDIILDEVEYLDDIDKIAIDEGYKIVDTYIASHVYDGARKVYFKDNRLYSYDKDLNKFEEIGARIDARGNQTNSVRCYSESGVDWTLSSNTQMADINIKDNYLNDNLIFEAAKKKVQQLGLTNLYNTNDRLVFLAGDNENKYQYILDYDYLTNTFISTPLESIQAKDVYKLKGGSIYDVVYVNNFAEPLAVVNPDEFIDERPNELKDRLAKLREEYPDIMETSSPYIYYVPEKEYDYGNRVEEIEIYFYWNPETQNFESYRTGRGDTRDCPGYRIDIGGNTALLDIYKRGYFPTKYFSELDGQKLPIVEKNGKYYRLEEVLNQVKINNRPVSYNYIELTQAEFEELKLAVREVENQKDKAQVDKNQDIDPIKEYFEEIDKIAEEYGYEKTDILGVYKHTSLTAVGEISFLCVWDENSKTFILSRIESHESKLNELDENYEAIEPKISSLYVETTISAYKNGFVQTSTFGIYEKDGKEYEYDIYDKKFIPLEEQNDTTEKRTLFDIYISAELLAKSLGYESTLIFGVYEDSEGQRWEYNIEQDIFEKYD